MKARAYPRVGLLGNPSDQYRGKVVAFTFDAFEATVELTACDRFRLVPSPQDALEHDGLHEQLQLLERNGVHDGLRLMRAALLRFHRRFQVPPARFELRYATDIPRQVGLAGSSALVLAAMRALAGWWGREIPPEALATAALEAEVEELGIAAGPMDRMIQALEGLVLFDFATGATTRLDPRLLPPLFVAWDLAPGEFSGRTHSDVRARYERGDQQVRGVVAEFPGLVERGVQALRDKDVDLFRRLVDQNFDLRASVWPIRSRDRDLVTIGRDLGAAVKFCGSGGAVVGVPRSPRDLPRLQQAYQRSGCGFLEPRVA